MSSQLLEYRSGFQSKKSRARCGTIITKHGSIQTPCFIPVGTQGSVKSVDNRELRECGTQIFFVNTYHMLLRPGIRVIEEAGGLHAFTGWNRPLITDSGGFQVFSLGRDKYGKTADFVPASIIDDKGVTFKSHWDGSLHRLTPSESINIQHNLGADLIIAFDDCTSFPVNYETALESMRRTHVWAQESFDVHLGRVERGGSSSLYGSIQGSVYKDLREQSARFITSIPFNGFAIGGVAIGEGKEYTENVLKWVTPFLPENKPRHLLGVGEIDDVFTLVRYGIDTFDCVMPTRLARMGFFLNKDQKIAPSWRVDIQNKQFACDFKPINSGCMCYACLHYSRAYIHHLFKVRELLGYRLLTLHNLVFMHTLLDNIRRSIVEESLDKLEKEYVFWR